MKSIWDAPERMEVLPPVRIIEIGITDGTSTVKHHVVANIDTAMGNSRSAFDSAIKEHNVTKLHLIHRYIPAKTPKALCPQPPSVISHCW